MPVAVKICGVNDRRALDAAVAGGADYLGFVFFPPSPRCVTLDLAAALTRAVPASIVTVGLFVEADDEAIAAAVGAARLDALQAHGAETVERVATLRARFGRPVIKAIPVAGEADLATAARYQEAADLLLFDAAPPADATRPGGNARAFDWTLLKGRVFDRPWLLAGGLTPETVAAAIEASGAPGVDVSSGVEDRPGVKSVAKIEAFLASVRGMRAHGRLADAEAKEATR